MGVLPAAELRSCLVQLRHGSIRVRETSKIVELERCVLRFACNGELDPRLMADALLELAAYNWQDQDNRVVFEALKRARSGGVVPIRAQLTEHATRAGFPDIDWGNYLSPTVDDAVVDHRRMKQAIAALLATQTGQ
jgi:hypothetical protein